MHGETLLGMFPGKMNHVPGDVAALGNTVCISRDACWTSRILDSDTIVTTQ